MPKIRIKVPTAVPVRVKPPTKVRKTSTQSDLEKLIEHDNNRRKIFRGKR